MAQFGIYIHWPFCESKCPYCDFNSHVRDGIDQRRWRLALLSELEHSAQFTQGSTVSSVFFGGGTPSLFSASSVEKIIEYVDKSFGIDSNAEITLESNPSSSEKEKFKNFLKAGVNRI